MAYSAPAPATIRVLLVDDDQDYDVLTRDLLSEFQSGHYELDWKADYSAGLTAMLEQRPDVCLLDYDLGEHTGVELLEAASQAGATSPVIMLTGHGGRQVDMAAMRAGAVDYVSKTAINAASLERAIRYAVERAATLRTVRESERHIAELYQREQDRNQELEAAYSSLRRAEASRDDLVHMLIHDLRGPLTTILLSLDLIGRAAEHPTPGATAVQPLLRAESNVRRVLDMINDLLKMSRLEGGTLQPNRQPIDLPAWLAERASDYRLQAERTERAFSLHLPESLPVVEGDADLLGRVLDNLVANALKFTPDGGEIAVSAERQPGRVVLRVRDDGPGVAPEDRERIFEKFYQSSLGDQLPARTGIGIGLTFCRLAVAAHGGAIWVEDSPTGSSVFAFSLPVDGQA